MSHTVIPYARFQEIRLRRQHVQTELTRPTAVPPSIDDPLTEPPAVELEPVSDEQCDTRVDAVSVALPIPGRFDSCRKF